MAGLFDDLIPATGSGAPAIMAPPSGNEARVPVTAFKPGAFDDLIPAAPEEQPTTVTGTLDAFGRGVAKGAGFGWADEAGAAARYLGGKVFPWQPEVTYDEALREVRGEDKAVADANPTADVAGQVTGVVGSAAALPRMGLSATAKAIDSGAKLGKVARASALDTGVMGTVAGAGDAEGGLEERARGAVEGGVGGVVLGAIAPAALSVAGSAVRKAISPFISSPQRMKAVETLAREGVETTAGQRTGNNTLRFAESELGGQRAADLMERQGEQFTAAALKRAGIDAERATPEVVDQAFSRIGKQFDDLAARNKILPDQKMAKDLGASVQDYFAMVPPSQRAPVVMDTVMDIGNALKAGPLDGAAYQSLRSRLDRLARGTADPQLKDVLFNIRNTLDDGMERSMKFFNPKDVDLWKEARNQYRNMIVLEKASTGAGENAANGIISPSSLRNATVSGHGRRNYARGKGDFAELARAGEAVLKPLPNSGTAGRLNAQSLGLGVAGLFGGGAGYASGGDPSSMIGGAAAGFLAPRIAGNLLMQPAIQGLLSNQLGRTMVAPPPLRSLLHALVNRSSADESAPVGELLLGR